MADNVVRSDVVQISFEADFAGLKKIQSELDKLQNKAGTGVGGAIDKTTQSVDGLTKSLSQIGKSTGLSKLQSDIETGSAAIAVAKEKIDNLNSAIKKIAFHPIKTLDDKVKAVQMSTGRTIAQFKRLASTKISGVKQKLGEIKTTLTEGEHGAKGFKNALKNIGRASVGKVVTGIASIKTHLANGITKAKSFASSLKNINLTSLKKIDTAVTNLASKIGKGLVSAAKKAAKAMAVIGTAVGGVAAKGVQYNAQMETYQTSFEVMTGSAEKAASVTKKLQEMGAATPFEMTDLADTTQLLMNYGLTADDAIKRMSMLGDISQGDADKLNRVAMAYGQMSSAGKVSLEDVKQMIEFCPVA